MSTLSALLFSILVVAVSSIKTYDNYKVFKVTPTTDKQLQFLRIFNGKYDDYQFWEEPGTKFRAAHLMVSPRKLTEFTLLTKATGMDYHAYIEDVQGMIDKVNPPYFELDNEDFSWTRYHTLDEIYAWFDTLAARYSEAEVVVGGTSYEKREIKGVKLSFGARAKPGVFVEGGIHANEWIGTATVTYLLNEMLTSQSPQVRRLAESFDWYFFPVFNPDGYVYTFEEDRMWRKTREPNKNGCFGVDPNRNWDYEWMSIGASDYPCDHDYAGERPFSTIETNSTSRYISSISDKLFAYISFHSFGQHMLLPYGHTKEHLDNYDELYAIGKKTIDALAKRYRTKYDVGNIPEVLYYDSGSSMDWVKGKLKLPLAFTYELRDKGLYGFLAPAEEIIPTGTEVLDSFITMFDEAAKFGYPKKS